MNQGTLMGWQLVREAEDHGPASLTWRERFALSVLANSAIDDTRQCPHGIEDNPDVIRRLRLSRSARFEVIAALCEKGALVRVERGRNGVKAVYAIAPFVVLAQLTASMNGTKHPGNPDASPVDNPPKGPRNPDASRVPQTRTLDAEGSGKPGPKHPGNPDPRWGGRGGSLRTSAGDKGETETVS